MVDATLDQVAVAECCVVDCAVACGAYRACWARRRSGSGSTRLCWSADQESAGEPWVVQACAYSALKVAGLALN